MISLNGENPEFKISICTVKNVACKETFHTTNTKKLKKIRYTHKSPYKKYLLNIYKLKTFEVKDKLSTPSVSY